MLAWIMGIEIVVFHFNPTLQLLYRGTGIIFLGEAQDRLSQDNQQDNAASVQSLTKTDMTAAESRKSTIGLVNGLSNKLISFFGLKRFGRISFNRYSASCEVKSPAEHCSAAINLSAVSFQ
jgi:hypothetical protein